MMGYVLAFVVVILANVLNTPDTEVVLLDNNRDSNKIIIQKNDNQIIIDKANTYVVVGENDISKPKKLTQKELVKKYGSLVSKEIPTPISLLFYFKSGSEKLTIESEKNLVNLLPEIQKRTPCDVTVIGHSDTQGNDESNINLSIKRANTVKEWIIKQKVRLNSIKVESYGEKDLAVKTKDNVSEAKNRRVEVQIR